MRPNLASQFPRPKPLKPARHHCIDCCPVLGCQPGNFLDHSLSAFFIKLTKSQSVQGVGHILHQTAGNSYMLATPCWGLPTSQPNLSRKTMTTPRLGDTA